MTQDTWLIQQMTDLETKTKKLRKKLVWDRKDVDDDALRSESSRHQNENTESIQEREKLKKEKLKALEAQLRKNLSALLACEGTSPAEVMKACRCLLLQGPMHFFGSNISNVWNGLKG